MKRFLAAGDRTRPRPSALHLVLVLVVLAVGVTPAATAQSPAAMPRQGGGDGTGEPGRSGATAGQLGPGEDPPPGVGLSRAVEAVPLVSAELDAARAELEEVRDQRGADTSRLGAVLPELADLAVETRSLERLVSRREAQIRKAEQAHVRSRSALRAVAVEWFISGFGALDGLDPALTADERDQLAHRYMLSESGAYAVLEDERRLGERISVLRSDRDRLDALLGELVERAASLDRERVELTRSVEVATGRIPVLEQRVSEAAMGATVEGTDLSATALDAYWRAERAMALVDPACGVSWWVLAGIGRTESHHGTYLGSTLGTDGRVDPPVYGPHLDGSNAFAIVPDSDGGVLDGTAATDRATGPMQFLPGTWRIVGTDGDGDGAADPQNLFDAATSAGVYLCRSGPGLDDDARLRPALLTYNRSMPYVEIVLERGRSYRAVVPLG